MARDDFTQKVKEQLAKQVAYICSNPEHRVVTIGPSQYDKTNSIGEAAHICAASKGGPRYDESMTSDERKSIDNGIWLCANCAKDIDRDVILFPVDVLKKWKAKAIASARAELGKKLPKDTDTINTLTTALAGNAIDLPITAVDNIHLAVEQTYQNLDPRFTVKSSRIDGQTRFDISANESVPLNIQIAGISVDEFKARYQSLNDHGEELKISSDSVRVTGSKLFEKISNGTSGLVTSSPNKIPAKQKIWFESLDKSRHETFDDIDGFVVGGSKSFSFSGSNCGGLFSFGYTIERGFVGDMQFKMGLQYKEWDGRLVSDLPYFEKVYSYFKRVLEGWTLFTSLEVDGKVLSKSEGDLIAASPEIKNLVNLLHYTNRARIVAAALKLDIEFTSTVSFNEQQHCDLADAAELFHAPLVSNDKNTNFSCTVRADKNAQNIRGFLDADPQLSVLELPQNSSINVFGLEVDLPTKIIRVEKVQAKVQNNLEDVKEGELVTIDWLPVDGFKVSISFEKQKVPE